MPAYAKPLVWIALVTGLVYWNSLEGEFLFDDYERIVDSEEVHRLSLAAAAKYPGRMLVDLTFQLNYAWGGLKPLGYHLANIAIHAAAAMVLYDLVRRTLLLPGIGRRLSRHSTGLALAVALLWAAHPLCSQAVTYIVQRYESLMGLLYLLAIYCVLRGATALSDPRATALSSRLWYFAAVLAALSCAMCKEVAITLPAVLLAYDWAFLSGERTHKPEVPKQSVPGHRSHHTLPSGVYHRRWLYLAMILPAAWVLYGLAPTLLSGEASTVGFNVPSVSSWEYLRSQPAVLLEYLRLAFWPDELVLDRGWPVETSAWRIYGLGAVILALLGIVLWSLWRHRRAGAVGLALFLILAPTSSIVPIQDLAYEHRMYLPLAAVIILTVVGAWQLIERMISGRTRRRQAAIALVAAATLLLGIRTHLRNRDYCDSVAFWAKNVLAAPHHPRAYKNLAWRAKRAGFTQEAKVFYARLLQLSPKAHKARVDYGTLLFEERDFAAALAQYERAVADGPQNYVGWLNLGRTRMVLGDYAGAIAATRRAVPLAQKSTSAAKQLAWLLATAPDDAVRNGREAVEIATAIPNASGPIDIQLLETLAAAHAEAGQFDQAVRYAEECRAAAEGIASPRTKDLAARVELYRSGRAFRFEPPTPLAGTKLGSEASPESAQSPLPGTRFGPG